MIHSLTDVDGEDNVMGECDDACMCFAIQRRLSEKSPTDPKQQITECKE